MVVCFDILCSKIQVLAISDNQTLNQEQGSRASKQHQWLAKDAETSSF